MNSTAIENAINVIDTHQPHYTNEKLSMAILVLLANPGTRDAATEMNTVFHRWTEGYMYMVAKADPRGAEEFEQALKHLKESAHA